MTIYGLNVDGSQLIFFSVSVVGAYCLNRNSHKAHETIIIYLFKFDLSEIWKTMKSIGRFVIPLLYLCVILEPCHSARCKIVKKPETPEKEPVSKGRVGPRPCNTNKVACGQPVIQPITTRVVGGREAIPGSWPWTVMLAENGLFKCGASIVSERYLVSAAHCFEGKRRDPARWLAVAGRHRIDRVSRYEIVVKISKIITHENYDEVSIANDIALMVLAEPLQYNSVIRPVCLPQPTQGVTVGQKCILAGWGTTMGKGLNRVLNQVSLPVISDTTCAQTDWYGTEFIPETTFCAGYAQGGKDACTGDSGGALVCYVNGSWYAQGITSWGSGCAQRNFPGIYTDVSKYTTWLQNAVTKEKDPCPIL